MVDSEEYQRAKKSLLYRLSRQAIHSAQAKRWLKSKGFSAAVIETVTASLQEKGLIQDQEWLNAYVEAKKRKYGARRLQQNLRLKGMDLSLSAIAVSPEEESASLMQLLHTRYRHKDLRDPKDRASVFAALVRRGFGWAAIQSAITLSAAARDSLNSDLADAE